MIGHLIHVGYPKTGSTFLRRWFSVHRQLAYREGALGGYSDVHAVVEAGVTPPEGVVYRVTSCENFTAPRRQPRGKILSYTDAVDPAAAQANICSELAALFPNAHVLIVTRGFRAMILSSFSQYVRTGGEATLEQLFAHPPPDDPWDYDHVVTLYRQGFGHERVTVMPYELLRDDPDQFLRTLEAGLGLAHCSVPPDRVNASLSPSELYWYPRLSRAVSRLPIGSRLKLRYKHAAFDNRFRRLITVLQRLRPGAPVTADAVPDHVVAAYRGKAEVLRGNPLYAPYAQDYGHSDR